ncbi:type I pullulanase [Clostridium sediminicola]|uniref:type I pullulanase n=1 Tax=Clostridium sediminicola TaxID=3114879 RepID=UPI0031F25299
MRIIDAFLVNFNNINIKFDNAEDILKDEIILINGTLHIKISKISVIKDGYYNLSLSNKINIKFESTLIFKNITLKLSYSSLFKSEEFNKIYSTDKKLGYSYTSSCTEFRLWSPAATSVSLLLYKTGDSDIKETPEKYDMYEENGVWTIKLYRNLKNYFFNYKVKVYDSQREVVDPYTPAVGINGMRGSILDLKDTNPVNWEKDLYIQNNQITDTVIYEINIKDITSNKNSSILNRGKYLGLTENNTMSIYNQKTGFSHIKELSITHVQIMPFYDFSQSSIDEKNPIQYNWGYDPVNLNAPEGVYSTDPFDPKTRILELKSMIQHFHNNNIGVIMDVVYNHLFKLEESNFYNIFPKYYFRYYNSNEPSNGTGCGNDTASENVMMRRFIIDSVCYWAKEYHIDGFRFDLMGIHDIETMKEVYSALKKINPNIIIYGEGWDLNTNLPTNKRATINNSKKLPEIGFFNDYFRDILKGNIFAPYDKGYVNGKPHLEYVVKNCILGSIGYNCNHQKFLNPTQSINFISCHDNHTLWDKFQLNSQEFNIDEKKQLVKLANVVLLTSQGVPFLHSGMEFCRTKKGVENSYKSPDEINSIDWKRKADFKDVYEYTKGLIKLRLAHPAFRIASSHLVKQSIEFIDNVPENVVAFFIKNYANNDEWKNILIIYNPNKHSVNINLPYKSIFHQVVNKYYVGEKPIKVQESNMLHVECLSANIYYEK